MPTLYDEVLYPNLPFAQTHPDRLATIGTLFGMDPAPLAQCRVLEVGCGGGDNLIPMAFHYPDAEFLGIDAAEVAIGAGNEEIAALGLNNIRLEHGDIMDAPTRMGTFDYVISHGLYSWVPEHVRDRLMAIIQASLAPQGVAFVSYNALPGGRIREMLREMMLFHLDGAKDLDARIQGAHEVVRWFQECRPGDGESGVVRDQLKSILERRPQCLYHDELGEVYHPVYFQEFVAHAGRVGLQYLSEATYHDMYAGEFPATVVEQVDRAAGGNRIRREQYFDFLRCRMFRQTLLCRQDVALAAEPMAERLRRLYVSSAAKPVSPRPNLSEGIPEEFRGGHGSGITSAHPFTKGVMQLLSEAWPQAVSFADLLASAAKLAPQSTTTENLAAFLLATYAPGVIELHAEPAQCVSRVSQRPVASGLARSQARRGKLITTTRHTTIKAADEKARLLIGMLDGTHDIDALAHALEPESRLPKAELLKDTGAKLEVLARAGLLVG
jgi:methyltransferase-like protein/2-polyprenyl-3-methyl-5-hydroxy-6-metoxy-1,4-benzoquinol methylase